MKLRQGKTRSILESSINCALHAVEDYNRPRTVFRSESYITLMVMAWTKLFHAHFHRKLGDRYYYKENNGRYKIVDGERKAWELATCIDKNGGMSAPVNTNLRFFIKLRNKIEHRYVSASELDTLLFGECQSLLYNYESTLVSLFGEEFAISENLAYALQFSTMRTKEQVKAQKSLMSGEFADIVRFIETFRSSIPQQVFDSQEYSIKLIQIPRISNTNRSDLAVEFVRWSELSDEDRENFDKLTAVIKDKVVKQEVVNVGRLKPSDVIASVSKTLGITLNHYHHRCLYVVFGIRPVRGDGRRPADTNSNYCHFDEVHEDYVYQQMWVDFLIRVLSNNGLAIEDVIAKFKNGEALEMCDFE